jgi:ABC-type transporter Mla subunit MlaD
MGNLPMCQMSGCYVYLALPVNTLPVGRDATADIRTSLLDSSKSAALSNGSAAVDLSHDPVANRDSYISFPGGFDNGLPGTDVPDLMG